MILAIAIGFSTFHVLRFEIDIVSIVYLGHHGPLDYISNLSSGWKGCHFRILAGYEQRRVQGFQNMSEIVSDDTFFYALEAHIKFVVDTSGWHTTLTGNTQKIPNAMIGGPRRRSRSMVQNCA